MSNEREPLPIGELLATESVKQVVANMEGYCACEKRVIELTNEPRILALRYQAQLLQEEEAELVDSLKHAPPPSNLRSRRLKAAFYYAITALLIAAGCYFSFISLEPFRFGIKSLLYCAAVAVLTPFLVHFALLRWDTERLIKWAAAVAGVAAITGVMLLAIIRGNIFIQEFESMSTPVVIDDTKAAAQRPENDFYKNTDGYLIAFMILMALAMELGAGLALYEGSRMLASDSEDWAAKRERLALVRESLVGIIHEACTRQIAGKLFVQQFCRDFYRAMLTQTARNAITKLVVLLACSFTLLHARANAEMQFNLVIAVDLTGSVAVQGPDGKTEFEKNIDAVGKVLAEVPADTKLTVIGITDASFSQPYILFSAKVPDDPGYFGERLRAVRNQLVTEWKNRSAILEPKFKRTDIIGALLLAGQIFDQTGSDKILVIFSDMRNDTTSLNLDSPASIASLAQAPNQRWVGKDQLQGIKVFVLGVDDSGRSAAYWQSLKEFWARYFQSAGAEILRYSALRNIAIKYDSVSLYRR